MPIARAATLPPDGRRHNFFFALQPDEATRERIARVAAALKIDPMPRGHWVPPHRYHMTLRYLGAHADLPDDLVTTALAAGDRVRSPAFEFALDRVGSFANRSIPWWVGCREMPSALDALWRAIDAGFEGATTSHRVAHVTLLRDADRRLPGAAIEPVVWRVDRFVLIDSVLGPKAAHRVLRSWTLAP